MFSWLLWFNVGGVNVTWSVCLTLTWLRIQSTATLKAWMEESCRSCENAEVRHLKRSSPSLWPRIRPLKLRFVAFVGWFSVCACSRAVKCCTEEPFSRSHILWPFPHSSALWLCWDFIEFINVFLGEALCICAKLFCRRFRVYMSIIQGGYSENVWRRAQLVKHACDKGRKHIPNVVLERLYVLSDQTQATWDSARKASASTTVTKPLTLLIYVLYSICSVWLLRFCYFHFFCWFYKKT